MVNVPAGVEVTQIPTGDAASGFGGGRVGVAATAGNRSGTGRDRRPAPGSVAQSFETSRRIRKKDGCREKPSTAAVDTAFCFQLAMKAQGASSRTIVCISL